ncbi:MAG: GNAT family N-acetyltransferase [Sutterella sp.]|nr:GNAT family N-acetyltransferase [Sutterella sp.]
MFSIRQASAADLDILTDIEAASFPPEEKATRESFEKRLAVFPDCFLILCDGERPIGLIDGMVTDQRTISDDMFDDAGLHNPRGQWQSVFGFCVVPDMRGKGCAPALMKAFIEKARQEGRRGLILTCKEPLIHYYEQFGYVNRGVSKSVHGGAVWYDMELEFSRSED